ncbi:MAG TPA: lanthionine synthetase C family protein [Thermoanaerobaculia bacterium]|nr:lanthionine synthetase C family protein [Thermoanaerobaculia bacterium]
MKARWRPLLEGELASRAREAVDSIAAALATESARDAADRALLFGYLALTGGAPDDANHYAERSGQLLDVAFDALATTPMGPALYGGFSGVAWVAEHLAGKFDETVEGDGGEEIDEILEETIAAPWNGSYDLISGLTGFGVIALERLPRPSAIRCLEAIVDRLTETAEPSGDGLTWFTSPDLLPMTRRERFPHGYYDLGVAHGVPGVIALLSAAYCAAIRPEQARGLIEGAVRWLLSQRLRVSGASCYPAMVAPDVSARSSRLAWCYGDAGVAATLLHAARAVGVEEWERAALEIATHAAMTELEESGVKDAGLCHGAFGLAHIYNRLFQAGGGDVFAVAARRWYGVGLDMRAPGRGIAGFEEWALDSNGSARSGAEFLTGATGIGLALLAGITSVPPMWDRLLLVSIPPGGD